MQPTPRENTRVNDEAHSDDRRTEAALHGRYQEMSQKIAPNPVYVYTAIYV